MVAKRAAIKRIAPGIIDPAISELDIAAMVACVNGNATPMQAKHAIDWIMREAARVHDLSFQFGGDEGRRLTDFAEGRRYVGMQIRRLLQPETLRIVKQGGDGQHMSDLVAQSFVPNPEAPK